jgi:hypothetical protein
LKTNKSNKLINPELWEQQLISIYLGSLIPKIFAKKSGISALRRVKPFISTERDTLISIYNAIVRPYFDYCSEVWDVFGETQSKRLQKLQNKAARTISNMSNDVDHSIALCALGWKPLDIMRKKAKATMMYKTLNGIGPESPTNLFTYKNEITNIDSEVFQVVFVCHNHAPIA